MSGVQRRPGSYRLTPGAEEGEEEQQDDGNERQQLRHWAGGLLRRLRTGSSLLLLSKATWLHVGVELRSVIILKRICQLMQKSGSC